MLSKQSNCWVGLLCYVVLTRLLQRNSDPKTSKRAPCLQGGVHQRSGRRCPLIQGPAMWHECQCVSVLPLSLLPILAWIRSATSCPDEVTTAFSEGLYHRGLLPGSASHDSGSVWVAARELKLSYHNPETILSTIHPYSGHSS